VSSSLSWLTRLAREHPARGHLERLDFRRANWAVRLIMEQWDPAQIAALMAVEQGVFS
jgi:hypothetical protein